MRCVLARLLAGLAASDTELPSDLCNVIRPELYRDEVCRGNLGGWEGRLLCHCFRRGKLLQSLGFFVILGLLLELFVALQELIEGLILGPLLDVEGQWQDIKWVLSNAPIVVAHVVEQSILIAEVVVGFHLGVDAPLVAQVHVTGGKDVELGWLEGLLLLGDLSVLLFRLGLLLNRNSYLDVTQDRVVILLLPLSEDEVVLTEVFPEKRRGLPWQHHWPAVLVQACLRE